MSNNRFFLTALSAALLMSSYAQATITHNIANNSGKDAFVTIGYSDGSTRNLLLSGYDNKEIVGGIASVSIKLFDDQRGNCLDQYTGKKMFYLKIRPEKGLDPCQFIIETATSTASPEWPFQVIERGASTGSVGKTHVPWSNKNCPLL